ncbi:head decoration protein [Herbiconiux sp. KACC 21604]|uniref:head decoration protein n=1 Tax=unclassified Herbiconiux TaxID=2618217 RepID=UPI0014922541|nr:head decoration protein [Herbiconiux sp. SALV-R1]QJU54342.1 head decoration protein [Herbiconiux sp. SALV-R1]WPO85412.1 head decoration protein [Herbiconiux sp. KACC 21604]
MDLSLKTETFGQEDQTWLDSAHGTDAARSVTIDITKGFTAGTHWPAGHLPSGTKLGKVTASGKYGLYDDAATDGRQTLVGFTLTAQKIGTGDVIAPLFDHGRVNESKLPFTVDAAGKADVAGRIQFV